MIGGRASVAWGEPCCAACAAGLAGTIQNPPGADPAGELAALFTLHKFLGEALAWGALAGKLGIPAGADLVASVASFVAESPTLGDAEVSETGGFVGSVESAIAGAERAAPRGWAKVRAAATATLETLGKVPLGLAAVGVGALLASQFLSANEKVKLAALAADKQILGETIARVDPADAIKALSALGIEGGAGGGGLFDGLAALLPWVIGGVVLWIALPIVTRAVSR